jgi:hypothetical protein
VERVDEALCIFGRRDPFPLRALLGRHEVGLGRLMPLQKIVGRKERNRDRDGNGEQRVLEMHRELSYLTMSNSLVST